MVRKYAERHKSGASSGKQGNYSFSASPGFRVRWNTSAPQNRLDEACPGTLPSSNPGKRPSGTQQRSLELGEIYHRVAPTAFLSCLNTSHHVAQQIQLYKVDFPLAVYKLI